VGPSKGAHDKHKLGPLGSGLRLGCSTIPSNIANRDYQLFEVAEILHYQGDPKRKSMMTFLVHWTGYSHDEDTWEPWAELRNNPKLHTYLKSKNLQTLIPKEHRH
jgi:hypothetical protein